MWVLFFMLQHISAINRYFDTHWVTALQSLQVGLTFDKMIRTRMVFCEYCYTTLQILGKLDRAFMLYTSIFLALHFTLGFRSIVNSEKCIVRLRLVVFHRIYRFETNDCIRFLVYIGIKTTISVWILIFALGDVCRRILMHCGQSRIIKNRYSVDEEKLSMTT